MARLDHVGVARADIGLGSVLVGDVDAAGLGDADVPDLAAVGAHDRLLASDHFQPGSNVMRAAVVPPTRITSTRVLSGVRVSSGESKSRVSTPATAVSTRRG